MVKVLDTVVKVKVCKKVKKKSCVSLLAYPLCSTQIIVYAKNSVFAFFKRPRFNLRFYLNTIQKTEGWLSR